MFVWRSRDVPTETAASRRHFWDVWNKTGVWRRWALGTWVGGAAQGRPHHRPRIPPTARYLERGRRLLFFSSFRFHSPSYVILFFFFFLFYFLYFLFFLKSGSERKGLGTHQLRNGLGVCAIGPYLTCSYRHRPLTNVSYRKARTKYQY